MNPSFNENSTASDPIMPKVTMETPGEVLWYDKNVPLKTITLINNTKATVFPIIRDANSRTGIAGSQYANTPIYDPHDYSSAAYKNKEYIGEEYRGYIGYVENSVNYLGLPAGQTVEVPIPLVFWDAGRMHIAIDGTYLCPEPTNENPNPPNPFVFRFQNLDNTPTARAIVTLGKGGIVMWYHAKLPEAPRNDAPDQLLEMTFRDEYLDKLSTATAIPKSEKHALVNYDVSYVDTMMLSVAMEAADVPVPIPPIPNSDAPRKAYGWVGASQAAKDMKDAIQAFTTDGVQNGLGQYFGGKGYAKYYMPNPDIVKLPACSTVIANSPLDNQRSSYDNDYNMLDSGGSGPLKQYGNGFSNGSVIEQFNPRNPNDFFKILKEGWVVTSSGPDIKPGTKVLSVDAQKQQIVLDQETTGNGSKDYSYDFTRPLTDYVADALINLWYSWAKFYVDNNTGISGIDRNGTTTSGSRDLKIVGSFDGLVPGMGITGPGIPAGTTISTMIKDQQLIRMSQCASSPNSSVNFTFDRPQPIVGIDKTQPFTLSFDNNEKDKADAFACNIYQVMHAMSMIPKDPERQLTTGLMINVFGCNVGKIETLGHINDEIMDEIRDMTKSILRGVDDFKKIPESEWYPDPSLPAGGRPFNVFNLHPFVWFVHKKLQLSGYGFSVDDDIADIGADYATKLQVGIGGLTGLSKKEEWTWGAPYGTVTGDGTVDPKKSLKRITGLSNLIFWQVRQKDPIQGPGAYVSGQGVQAGTRIDNIDLDNNTIILDKDLDPQLNPGTYTYTFFGYPSQT